MARPGGGRERGVGGVRDSRISDGKRRQQGARGGREIRLTQRENENEGRDVSTIDRSSRLRV